MLEVASIYNRMPFSSEGRRMRRFLAIASTLFLASCQTGAEYQANLDADRAARLRAWTGRTMAEFMRDTGMTPSNSYDTSAGRTFIVDGPAYTLAMAPGIVRTFGCRIQLETASVGN